MGKFWRVIYAEWKLNFQGVKNEGITSNIRQLLASLFAFAGVLCLTMTSCEEAVLETGTNATSTGNLKKYSHFKEKKIPKF